MKVLIAISFCLGFLLMVIPINFESRGLRPEFIVLLVIYWSMVTPQHFGLLSAWFVGLLSDLLEFSPLGVNAIGMMIMAYLAHMFYPRIRHYVFWHQSLWVFMFVTVFSIYSNWISGLVSGRENSFSFLLTALTSALLWPMLVLMLKAVQMRFRLSQSIHNNY